MYSKKSSIAQDVLRKLYESDKKSMAEIAHELCCSLHKVDYWLTKYEIPKRSRNEAGYIRLNPQGDPFKIKTNLTPYERELKGLELGLYWGEGNKANKWSVRLGNTDSDLIGKFIEFLEVVCGIDKSKLKYSLQVFSDMDPAACQRYWSDKLAISPSQLGKITVTISGSVGTYKNKNEYGVLTVYFHNVKLRNTLVTMLPR